MIDAIRARREKIVNSNVDAVYVEEYLSDVDALLSATADLQKQLDAAVGDMKSIVGTDKDTYETPCDYCKHYGTKDCTHPSSCPQRRYYFWKWRGEE